MIVDICAVKKHIKPKADSTLYNMKKTDLIEYIRTLEHNYNVAVSFNENQAKYIESLDLESLRPQGEWRKAEYKLKVYINCSVCGHLAGFVEQSNYCPNCGAYMKGAGENA